MTCQPGPFDLPSSCRILTTKHRNDVESRIDRRGRARALGAFFAAGATLSLVVLLLPGWDQMHRAGIAVTVVLAASGSGLLVRFADHFRPLAIHAMTASGTGLIAACQVLAGGGSATAMYAMLYIWVILHASLFFPRRVVAVHLVLTTLAHAGALVWLGDVDAIAPQLALTLGTQVAAALVVGSLAAAQRELADTDVLTGLGNRRVVDRTLDWAFARSRRSPSIATFVAVLDLDDFKDFNDEQGHAAGDLLLVEAAVAWRQLLRGTDALARTGGDEFVVVLTGCAPSEAEDVVRRMVAATPAGVDCSAGLARWDGLETPAELLERADRALYGAKGGGQLLVAEDPPHTQVAHPARPG